MKGKKILTLVSAAMGLAIVGSTFAAWAVTDNADPFGIKVSPGEIRTDDTTFVTLSYGTSTFANVDNLQAGKPRLAGSVLLKADTNDGAGNFNYSVFHVELLDETEAHEEDAAKLIDYLHVDVYSVAITTAEDGTAIIPDGATPIGTVPTTRYVLDEDVVDADSFEEEKEAHGKLFQKVLEAYEEIDEYDEDVEEYYYLVTSSIDIPFVVPSGTGATVYVVVSLQADLDPRIIDEIKSDVVYVGMDWNAAENTPIAQTSTIYIAKEKGAEMYCYAWDESGKNAAWPGVKMNDMGNGYYSYELKMNFKNAIFNISSKDQSSGEWTTTWQTVDLSIGTQQRTTDPTFKPDKDPDETGKYDGDWQAKPDPELTEDFYLVGKFNNVEAWTPVKSGALTEVDDIQYKKEHVTLKAGDLLKITNPNRTVWYSNESPVEGLYSLDSQGNVVVTNDGTYTINLWLNSANHNYIELVKEGA